ncbi:hypothetical protein FACS189418_2120 [Clostridia bacterium]|nr:hypothetical protein FACS189418_2120 [Clostridia bacterium]
MSNKEKLVLKIAFVMLCVGLIGSLISYRFKGGLETISEAKEFSPAELSHIQIDTDLANVKVISNTEEKILVKFEGEVKKRNKVEFRAEIQNNTLLIESKESNSENWFNFDIGGIKHRLDIVLSIPEKEYESLSINNHLGKIGLQGINVLHIDIQNKAGEINLSGINTKEIQAETLTGSIELKNINSQQTRTESKHGDIYFEQVTGALIGETTNGDIHVDVENIDNPIDLQTINGEIEIKTKQEPLNVRLLANTKFGNINILGNSLPYLNIGDEQNEINLSTINGSIIVRKTQ